MLAVGAWGSSTTRFRLKRAGHYMRVREYARAIAVYKKILRKETLYPACRTLPEDRISAMSLVLAELLLKENRYREAAVTLDGLVRRHPNQKSDIRLDADLDPEGYRRFGLWLLELNLKSIAAPQFRKIVELRPNDMRARYELALIYLRQGLKDEAKGQFKEMLNRKGKSVPQGGGEFPDCLGDAYYYLALDFEAEGKTQKAKEYYQKAILLNTSQIVRAYYYLTLLYEKADEEEFAKRMKKGQAHLNPQHVCKYKFSENVIFLGYSFNKREFELFNEGEITFFWDVSGKNQALTHEQKSGQDIYRIDNRLFQMDVVENLVSSFGFELDREGVRYAYGWRRDVYPVTPPERHEIVGMTASFGKDQCLLLNNSKLTSTGIASDPIKIDEESFYLQSGSVKSKDGNAFLGRTWFDSKKDAINYNYVKSRIQGQDWKVYSQVTKPLPHSAWCRLLVINHDTPGKAYFDDVLFVKLNFPKI